VKKTVSRVEQNGEGSNKNGRIESLNNKNRKCKNDKRKIKRVWRGSVGGERIGILIYLERKKKMRCDLNEVNDEARGEEEESQWDDNSCSHSQRISETWDLSMILMMFLALLSILF